MASQGPNSVGTGADDAAVGTLAWANPTRIVGSDDSKATATKSGSGTVISHYLKGTNCSFSIPTGATIDGIVFEFERSRTLTGNVTDNRVSIVKSDGSVGTENKVAAGSWPVAVDAYATYGSSSDLWSESWTPADINNSNFGAVMAANVTGAVKSIGVASVDHYRITVYYTGGAVTKLFQLLGVGT